MNKILFALSSVLLAVVGVYGLNLSPWTITYNMTESLPVGLYLSHAPDGPLPRDSLACFKYRAPDWAKTANYLPEGMQICKHVLGLPGDVVEQEDDHLFLSNHTTRISLGKTLKTDSKGRPVPHLNWDHTVIPAQQYYLGSTRVPRSFDSRYLGLVNEKDISARIYPLITF